MDETTDHVEAMQVGRRETAPLAHDRPRYSYYVEVLVWGSLIYYFDFDLGNANSLFLLQRKMTVYAFLIAILPM